MVSYVVVPGVSGTVSAVTLHPGWSSSKVTGFDPFTLGIIIIDLIRLYVYTFRCITVFWFVRFSG